MCWLAKWVHKFQERNKRGKREKENKMLWFDWWELIENQTTSRKQGEVLPSREASWLEASRSSWNNVNGPAAVAPCGKVISFCLSLFLASPPYFQAAASREANPSPSFFSPCDMHETRGHLKKGVCFFQIEVRCEFCFYGRTWKLYARERCLLFACYHQQINTTLTQNAHRNFTKKWLKNK